METKMTAENRTAEIKCGVIERNRELDQLNKVISIVGKMFSSILPNHVESTLVSRRWECAKELRELKVIEGGAE